MRNKRFLSLLMASLLTVQMLSVPAWAETTGDETDISEVTQETEDSSTQDESLPTEQGESQPGASTTVTTTTAPTQVTHPAPSVPSDFVGDASVSAGSHSINAAYPVIPVGAHDVSAKAAIAYEVGTDTLVYASNIDERLYPASMTKIMTCLVALEMCDLNEMVKVDGDAIAYLDEAGSGAGLLAGEEMSMENLLYCLMVKSANDAAVTIAHHLAGSEEAFVELMNQKAEALGCTNTHFANAHGLHDENHYTTARDMAKIMAACIQNETFTKLYSEIYYVVPATNLHEERELYTTNYLMSEALDQNYYDSRVIGGKTGFTTPAGRCLVSVSESSGMKLVIVVMGADAEFAEDGYSALSYGHFDTTVELMNLVYGGYKPTQVFSADQILEQFPVENGVTDAQGYVQHGVGTVIAADADINSLRYEYALKDSGIHAPVKAGDIIGNARVWYQNLCVAQQELYASVDVEKKAAADGVMSLVNPATLLNEEGTVWNWVLIIFLGVVAVLALLIIGISIRSSIIRARRRKRRAMQRRRRS